MVKKIIFGLLVLSVTACGQQKKSIASKQKGQSNAPTWANNAVLYEINTRQYSAAGTFDAVANDLERIKNLGVDILWFMPIQPIGKLKRKGTIGSPYSVQNYTATHADYGNVEDFKNLVTKAHGLGLKVIIDWVGNHTAWDNAWLTDHPDWYAVDSAGEHYSPWDWTDVVQLDYKNKEMRKAMIEAMNFWVKTCDIDGFRCDVAFLVPPDFWNEARAELEKNKPLFMLAEMETQKDVHPNPRDYYSRAFDAAYGWDMHGTMVDVLNEAKPMWEWFNMLHRMKTLSDTTWRMFFTTNHDENSWNGTEYEKFGSNYKLASVLTYTMPYGITLIYNGQEAANKKRLAFFEKDPINWSDTSMCAWYRKLNGLKHSEPALWNGLYGGDFETLKLNTDWSLFAYKRSNGNSSVITVANMCSKELSWDKKTALDLSKYTLVLGTPLVPNVPVKPFAYSVYILK